MVNYSHVVVSFARTMFHLTSGYRYLPVTRIQGVFSWDWSAPNGMNITRRYVFLLDKCKVVILVLSMCYSYMSIGLYVYLS